MEDNYLGGYNHYNDYKTDYQVPGSTFALSRAGRQSQVPQRTSYQPQRALSASRTNSGNFVSSQIKNQEVVKGESRINYVPYEKKVVEYQDRTYVQRVPVKKKVTQYREERVVETIPHEVVKTEYYAIEKRVEYHKQVIPEKKIEMVPVERKIKKYEYVPVEKQIIHYPQNVDIETAKGQSRVVLGQQGVNVKNDAEYRPIDSSLIYNYSSRPESSQKPVGYVDMGERRFLSNTSSQVYQPSFYPSQNQYQYTYQDHNYPVSGSPHLTVTDPTGRSALQHSGESYINNLNNIGRSEAKRPFQLLSNRKEEYQPEVKEYNDYGRYGVNQGYGQEYSSTRYSPPQRPEYNRFDPNTADWTVI